MQEPLVPKSRSRDEMPSKVTQQLHTAHSSEAIRQNIMRIATFFVSFHQQDEELATRLVT